MPLLSVIPPAASPPAFRRALGGLRLAGGRLLVSGLLCAAVIGGCDPAVMREATVDSLDVYEWTSSPSPHGTGKVYMGREIADVLGHVGAEWLERPARETAELPNRVVKALELGAADVVADIGAGTGYFTFRISPEVPRGKVYAVDIDPEMLEIIRSRVRRQEITNVEPVRGSITDPNLPPGSVDVALIVYSYPQFSHPYEMMTGIRRALKPGGRVVLVEYRGEDPTLPIESIYKITEAQARKELEALGFRWRETRDILPQQHFMVFEKPLEAR